MKKIFSLLLAALATFSMVSCQEEPLATVSDVSVTSIPSEGGGAPELLTVEHILALVENGKVEDAYRLVYTMRDDPTFAKLAERFLVMAQTVTRADPRIGVVTTRQEYDVRGNLIKETVDFAGKFSTQSDYAYDHMNNMVKETYSDGTGEPLVYRDTYTYDDLGNVLEHVHFTATGEKQFAYTYTYDQEGKLVLQAYTAEDPQWSHITEYVYDNQGRTVREVYTDDNGYETVSEYVYDGDFLQTVSFSDSEGNADTTEYAYDQWGNLISEKYRSTEALSYTYHYAYDGDGRLLTRTHIQEEKQTSWAYRYNEFGVLVQETYTADGLEFQTEYSDFLYLYIRES